MFPDELPSNVSGKLTVYSRSKNGQSTKENPGAREKDHADTQDESNLSREMTMKTPEPERANSMKVDDRVLKSNGKRSLSVGLLVLVLAID